MSPQSQNPGSLRSVADSYGGSMQLLVVDPCYVAEMQLLQILLTIAHAASSPAKLRLGNQDGA